MDATLGRRAFMPADSPDQQPSTQTTRVATDLMDMLREIAVHTKDARGRPMKLTDLLDSLLRPVTVQRHQQVMDRIVSEQTKGRKGKAGQ